jgi:pyruvate,orthophosphate dikinase
LHLQGLVDGDGAIMLVEPRHLDQLLHPTFENEKAYQRDVITRGLGASPGAAVGKLVFTAGKLCVGMVLFLVLNWAVAAALWALP